MSEDESKADSQAPLRKAWEENLANASVTDVPSVVLEAWKAIPPDQWLDLRLPKGAITALFNSLKSFLDVQPTLIKVSLAARSGDEAQMDEALAGWTEQMVNASNLFNTALGLFAASIALDLEQKDGD